MKFGLLGTGKWGKHYLRLLPQYGEVRIMKREIDPRVDCVVIATPAETHFKYIKEALEKGKHVLVEKPMVMSLREAVVIKMLLDNHKVFMVGHQYCYNDEILKQKPKKTISLKHSYQGENPEWEILPHLFSVADVLDFKGQTDFHLIKTADKIREWKFDGIKLKEPKREPLKQELEHFIDCIKNKKTPKTGIEHAIRVIKKIEYVQNY